MSDSPEKLTPPATASTPSAAETEKPHADTTPTQIDIARIDATQSFQSANVAKVFDTAAERIGRYRVLSVLGSGGFGRVYLAADDELRRQVAIKVITREQIASSDAEAYLAEARAVASLDHPHIVPVYDLGRTAEGAIYIVQKYIEGTTLQQQLKERRFEQREVVEMLQSLANAAHHAHQRNLVHRDIKPANILVDTSGRVHLTDFGLAGGPGHGVSDGIAGTPSYMSPEQADGLATDSRSDLFSLGVVMYELLTGMRPFRANEVTELLRLVCAAQFTPIPELNSSIPQGLSRICEKLLAKSPIDRYASADLLVTDLQIWNEEQKQAAAKNNVPTNLTAVAELLVGREQDIDQITERLSVSRLITLTGPGGVGKTCLAKAVARRAVSYPDGVYFVELATLIDSGLILASIASAVGCLQSGSKSVEELLTDWLAKRKVLLVIDNCEHLNVGQLLAQLLEKCSELHVLATSRAPLRIAGEMEFPVSLLSLPDSQSNLTAALSSEYSAVKLFVEKAREVLPAFSLTEQNCAAVNEICVRLDGLPLAIELAAARVNIFSPQSLLQRLKAGKQLMAARRNDIPERQQTLQQAIAWSYQLLPPSEQQLFSRLGVFSGGFTVVSAETVTGDELDVAVGISALLDNNLLRRDANPECDRLHQLQTIRDFAREQLNRDGTANQWCRRHAEWVRELVEKCESLLNGPEINLGIKQLHLEFANIRAALAWCLADSSDPQRGETGLRIGAALWRFWCMCGFVREGNDWMTQLLAKFDLPEDGLGAKACYAAGCLLEDIGEFAQAADRYHQAMRSWEKVGDERGLSSALIALGSVQTSQGNYDRAEECFRQALSLSQKLKDLRGESVALSNLGSIMWSRGEYLVARGFHEKALDIRRRIGNRSGVSVSLTSLGLICARLGDLAGAKILYEESLAIARELDSPNTIGVCLNNLGEIYYRLGDAEGGEALLWEAIRIQRQCGDRLSISYTLESLGAARLVRNDAESAARFLAAADTLRETLGAPLPPVEKSVNDTLIDEVRRALGPDKFAALWTVGRATPLEQLIEMAPSKS